MLINRQLSLLSTLFVLSLIAVVVEVGGGVPYLANNSPAPTVTSATSSSALIMERSSSPELSCLPKYKRDLVQKLTTLRQELQTVQPQSGHCRLEVSREDIFEESYRLIMKMRPKDLKKRLMVKFRGEEGLDYGGVAREWLSTPDSSVNPEHLSTSILWAGSSVWLCSMATT
ncbi:hypothetical protein MRX96_033258 [Rhipicephalus microplus]